MITNLQALLRWRPRPVNVAAVVRRVLLAAALTGIIAVTVAGVGVALTAPGPGGLGSWAAVVVVVLTGAVAVGLFRLTAHREGKDHPRPQVSADSRPWWAGPLRVAPAVPDPGELTAVMDAVRETPAGPAAAGRREFSRPVSELAEYRMVDGDVTALMDAVYGGPGRHSVDSPTQTLRVVR